MATLAEIRAKLAQQDTRGNREGGGDNTVYAHWNIPEGTNSRIRFLPDGDDKNTFFWVEQAKINLPFAGIKGQPDSKPVTIQVPCVEMWGMACPILAEVRTWFKDPSLEEMGRKYWKKKSYIFQGFVRENPMKEEKTPDNPIRRFMISPQIFNLVKGALTDPELENLPTDYDAGLDFVVAKSSKGGYANYDTSKWARKESALSSEELEAIEKYGLFNLAEFLPKRPADSDLKVLKEMFEASVDGQAYDPDRWSNYYRPRGVNAPAGSNDSKGGSSSAPATSTKPASKPAKQSVVEDDDDIPFEPSADEGTATASAPVEPKSEGTGGRRAEEILAMIRNRQKKET